MRFPQHLFRRVISSGSFLPELDGLRFLAIVPVVLFHATMSLYLKHAESGGTQASALDGSQGDAVFRSPLGWIASHGFLGVQLFFLISGFVVTLPFARHHLLGARAPRLQAFYLKRLTRIEPPYIIALCLFGLGVLAVAPENFRIADFASGLVYLRTALFGNEPWAFFISWSLEIEVQFYLIVPFLAMVFAIPRTAMRRTILVIAIAAGAAYAAHVRCSGSEDAPLGGPLQHGKWL
ncbi:MAG: acyltransferase, partial [Planctomycetaceae bacterium]|nr:acyltransferase [Planctomycetaceae bacterium]